MNKLTEKRFWKRIKIGLPKECWPWLGKLNSDGYGVAESEFILGYYTCGAHRIAYGLTKGKLPKGKFVLHRCNNASCCNPDHLYAGTKKDNRRDAMLAGTAFIPDNRGEKHGKHKLTEKQVNEILRDKTHTGYYLSKKYNISEAIICQIRKRKIWRHVHF